MYLDYFDKFKNQEPYLHIDEKEWTYIKDTFEKEKITENKSIIKISYYFTKCLLYEEVFTLIPFCKFSFEKYEPHSHAAIAT